MRALASFSERIGYNPGVWIRRRGWIVSSLVGAWFPLTASDSESNADPERDGLEQVGRFQDWLGTGPIEVENGRGRMELLVRRRHLRSLDILHGGVMASVLDSVMGVSTRPFVPDGHYAVTVQLNVNFIRPAWEGERLIATSEVQHHGKQTAVVRGEVRTEAGVLAGTASGTFLFLPLPVDGSRKIERRDDRPDAPADCAGTT